MKQIERTFALLLSISLICCTALYGAITAFAEETHNISNINFSANEFKPPVAGDNIPMNFTLQSVDESSAITDVSKGNLKWTVKTSDSNGEKVYEPISEGSKFEKGKEYRLRFSIDNLKSIDDKVFDSKAPNIYLNGEPIELIPSHGINDAGYIWKDSENVSFIGYSKPFILDKGENSIPANVVNNNEESTERSADIIDNRIYLDGRRGNDVNDGLTKEKPVKTFEKAKELALANSKIKNIVVTGIVYLDKDISLEGTSAKVLRDADYNGNLFAIQSKHHVTMTSIIIDGNSQSALKTAASLIEVNDATLTLGQGATLQNNKLKEGTYIFWSIGGAVNVDDGVLNIQEGSLITDNRSSYGGGIFLNRSVLNMSGGIIENNHAIDSGDDSGNHGVGGGIATYATDSLELGDTIINLSGGTIRNNVADGMGGAISLGYGGGGTNTPSVLNMTGGTIEGNQAGNGGGGIFVQAMIISETRIENFPDKYKTGHTANITGGTIRNNYMNASGKGNNTFGGGGIYVNGLADILPGWKTFNGVLNLKNAVITDNTAEIEGAGYAACPITETHFYLKDGVALFGNNSPKARDLYILASNSMGAHSGDPIFSIANSMLGGVPYNWKDNNGEEVSLNRLEGQLFAAKNESLSMQTDSQGNETTNKLAKVYITGNKSATRGGGVGSNGTVNFGTKDTISVDVTKRWQDNNDRDKKRPQEIYVDLYRNRGNGNDEPVYIGYEKINVDKKQDGKLTFTNLPKFDSDNQEYVYTIKERKTRNYKTGITGDQTSGFIITNTYEPELGNPSTHIVKNSPQTGDEDNIHLLVLLVVMTGVTIIGMKKSCKG